MRRFLADILAFALLQGIVCCAVWRACPRRDDHYAAASIDKRRRLATAPSPRIIFVGGSTVAFGVDSRLFEAEGYTPVNMGHNISLGLSFMLSQVEGELREGDVVIVSPEYPLFWEGGVDETLITHLEYDPAGLRHIDIEAGRRLCDKGLVWASRKLRCALHQVSTDAPIAYARGDFDERGDMIGHRGRPPTDDAPLPFAWPSGRLALDGSLRRLEEFQAVCEAAGARCVFAFSPIRRRSLAKGRQAVAQIEAAIAARLRMPVISTPQESAYPDDAFVDAGDHLTGQAAAARTRHLAAGLRRALARR